MRDHLAEAFQPSDGNAFDDGVSKLSDARDCAFVVTSRPMYGIKNHAQKAPDRNEPSSERSCTKTIVALDGSGQFINY